VRALIAAEAGAPPAAIDAMGGFIVQASGIHQHALDEQRGAFGGGGLALTLQLFEKLEVAEDGESGTGGVEIEERG
jgi:hypothetical protein